MWIDNDSRRINWQQDKKVDVFEIFDNPEDKSKYPEDLVDDVRNKHSKWELRDQN